MSVITKIQAVFANIKTTGTFLFESEIRQESKQGSIASTAFPLMVILDDVVSESIIRDGADWDETPTIKGYMLSKYDSNGNQITYDKTRLEKYNAVVEPMKQLAADVIARFFIEYQIDLTTQQNIVRLPGVRPTIRFVDTYDKFIEGLHGVYFEFKVTYKRIIDYEPNT